MKDYYKILGLEPGCTGAQVKKAYRALAKRTHPDAAGAGATARFLALKEAYEVLSSEAARGAYEETYRAARRGEAESRWDYRSFLAANKDDPKNLAMLVCYDLLHDRDSDAVTLYEEASAGGFFSLRRWLDREDFMDYGFLLAEAYLERGAVVKAYRLLRGIALLEEEDPYFRHFYAEVLERLASVVRNPIPDDPDGETRIAFLRDLTALSYGARDKARLHKLLSELLSARGDAEGAVRELYAAHGLYPKLPGVAEAVQALAAMGYPPPAG